jgi:hypothetical protein
MPRWPRFAYTAVLVFLATALVGALPFIDPRGTMDDMSLFKGVRSMEARAAEILHGGQRWPWDQFWPTGPMPIAVRYLAACTGPTDRLFISWSAPEYYYFARRAFAGGHALLVPPRSFTTDADQRLMLERLERFSVPVVLLNDSRRDDFASSYPLVDRYLEKNYNRAGAFTGYDGSVISIAIRRSLHSASVFEDTAWPCGLGEARAAQRTEERPEAIE